MSLKYVIAAYALRYAPHIYIYIYGISSNLQASHVYPSCSYRNTIATWCRMFLLPVGLRYNPRK